MRLFATLFLLAGCQTVTNTTTRQITVPGELRACADSVASPIPPPRPRTVEAIADWGNRTTVALEVADRRLAECNARRDAAVKLLEQIQ